ncbi:MAG: hypothetical protein HY078_13000 [Elusimicrobia bacterium]|nr:hypothetical protein [Elusimicrobiota bacterium]
MTSTPLWVWGLATLLFGVFLASCINPVLANIGLGTMGLGALLLIAAGVGRLRRRGS